MKTITCDKCKNVLREDDSRLGGSVDWVDGEETAHVVHLVYPTLDFCSVGCLSGFIHMKLKEFGVGIKS